MSEVGVGSGGLALGGRVQSGVVRGSAVVIDLVEGLSGAYNTTKNKVTSYENDNDNNDDNDINDTARRATLNAPVMLDLRLPPECARHKDAGTSPRAVSVPSQGVSSLDESVN